MLEAPQGVRGAPIVLSTAQTGNGDSTNTAYRLWRPSNWALVITSTIGATPTVTVNIQGSQVGLEHFEPVTTFGRWDVEAATAAPGEKRGD